MSKELKACAVCGSNNLHMDSLSPVTIKSEIYGIGELKMTVCICVDCQFDFSEFFLRPEQRRVSHGNLMRFIQAQIVQMKRFPMK